MQALNNSNLWRHESSRWFNPLNINAHILQRSCGKSWNMSIWSMQTFSPNSFVVLNSTNEMVLLENNYVILHVLIFSTLIYADCFHRAVNDSYAHLTCTSLVTLIIFIWWHVNMKEISAQGKFLRLLHSLVRYFRSCKII